MRRGDRMYDIIEKFLGHNGKLLCSSKGQYCFDNPDNIIVFNANVCTREDGKIFYGDIDITLEDQKLTDLSKELKKEVFILSEMDARFENEDKPLLDKYIFKTNGISCSVNKSKKEFIELRGDGKWYYKKVIPFKEEKLFSETPVHERDITNRYMEKDFLYNVRIPVVRLFFILQKDSPLEKFYRYVESELKRKYNLSSEEMKNLSVYITKEFENLLTKKVKYWLIQKKGLKEDTYLLQKELSWLSIEMPFSFTKSLKGPLWVKKNTVYARRR